MDKALKNVEDLVIDLELCGYAVTNMPGNRKRVDGTDGRQAFMPGKLSDKNLRPQIDALRSQVGFDPQEAIRRREAQRQERLAEAERMTAVKAERANNLRKAEEAARKTAELAAQQKEALRIQQDNAGHLVDAVEQMAAAATYVGSGQVRFDTMVIDYDFAKSVLDVHNNSYVPPVVAGLHTKTNRPLHNKHTLEGWAKDMVNGAWVLTPQGIAFDKDGNLLDGQNRLTALTMANESWLDWLDPDLPGADQRVAEIQEHGVRIPMVVSYDWDPAVFDRIDRGKPRGLGDLLAITGELDRHYLATTGRLAHGFDTDKESARIPASEHVILEYIKINQPYMSQAVAEARTVAGENRSRLLASGAAAGIFVIRRAWPQTASEIQADGDLVGEFLYGLGYGAMQDSEGRRLALEAGDPRAALRSYLNSPTGRKDRERRRHMGLMIKAWNRWVQGRAVEVMKLGKTEEFPVPVVRDGYVWDDSVRRFVPGS